MSSSVIRPRLTNNKKSVQASFVNQVRSIINRQPGVSIGPRLGVASNTFSGALRNIDSVQFIPPTTSVPRKKRRSTNKRKKGGKKSGKQVKGGKKGGKKSNKKTTYKNPLF